MEYCIQEEDGTICWVQKTVLMTQTIVFDTELSCEMPVVHAIILLQDTSQMHARDEQEHARLQAHLMKCGRQTGLKQILKPHESRYPDTAQWHYRAFENR